MGDRLETMANLSTVLTSYNHHKDGSELDHHKPSVFAFAVFRKTHRDTIP